MRPLDRRPGSAEDQAFARFRAGGNPEDVATVFDLTAPKLILVAIHLVRDTDDAEDLLQLTFLEAIKRAQSFDPGRPVLPWLLTIMSRRAANKRRDKERRRERPDDGAELLSTDPSPDEVVERNEAVEHIAAAMEELREPYREVLVLKLVNDLRPIEIARALNRPVGTVHTQLHRGLEMLRRVLPKGLAVPGALLAVGGHCLASVRAHVVAAAAAVRPASLAVVIGGVLMKKTLLTLGALVVIALVGSWWFTDSRMQPNSVERADTDVPGVVLADTRNGDSTGAGEESSRRTAARRQIEAGGALVHAKPGSLLFRVRWKESGQAAESVPIDVTALHGRDPIFATIRVATDRFGQALLPELEPGSYSYTIPWLASRDVEVLTERRSEIDHALPSGVSADVQVVHADGTPAARAEVWLYRGVLFSGVPFPPGFDSGRRVAFTDVAGRCRLRGLDVARERIEAGGSHATRWNTPWIGARLSGHAPSALHCVDPRSEEPSHEFVLRLGNGCSRIDGLVFGTRGHPVAGAVVEARPLPAKPQIRELGFTLDRFPTATTTDQQGRFALQSLVSSQVTLRFLAKGYAPYEESLKLGPDGSVVPVTVRLTAGAAIYGHVGTKAGRSLARVRVSVAGRTVESGPSGAFRVDALAAGRYECRFRADGFRAVSKVVDVVAGSGEPLDVLLESLVTIRGHLVDENGERLAGWHVRADPMNDLHQRDVTTTNCDEEGAFSLDVAAEREYALSVREPETVGLIAFPHLVPVIGGRGQLVLTVPNGSRATCFFEGYLVGLDGRPLVGQIRVGVKRPVHLWEPPFEHDQDTGHIVVGPIPPGESELRISSKVGSFAAFRSGPHQLRPHERKALGRLVPPPTGILEVLVDAASGADVVGGYVDLIPQEGTAPSARRQHRLEAGKLELSMKVQLGRYTVRLWGDGVQTVEKSVEVTAKGTVKLVLNPSPGRRRAIVCSLPAGEEKARISIRAADSSVVWRGQLTSDRPSVTRHIVFGVGRYAVEAVAGSGRRYMGEVVVTDLKDQTKLTPLLRPVR